MLPYYFTNTGSIIFIFKNRYLLQRCRKAVVQVQVQRKQSFGNSKIKNTYTYTHNLAGSTGINIHNVNEL